MANSKDRPDGGQDGTKASPMKKYRRYRIESRQEISHCLKYVLFIVNFLFWLCGIGCTILAVYFYAKYFRPVVEAIDFFLNPMVVLILCACLIVVIAFLGCTGALRENVCMLKLFSLCLFFAYICLVVVAFIVFILFYSDTKTGISVQSLLQMGVNRYHDNENMHELMDYLQLNLGCCGATSQGYKDWGSSPLYNCSQDNPVPEHCGVPPSCCKPQELQTTSPQSVPEPSSPPPQVEIWWPSTSASPLNSNFFYEPQSSGVPNPRCGFHAQEKSITDLQNVLFTDGCLQPLQRVFESNAVIIGAIIGAIIVPVCLSVTCSNVLARQIERQRYLLDKEARREERRRRRNRSKFRDPFAEMGTEAELRLARHAVETTGKKDPATHLFVQNELTSPPLNPAVSNVNVEMTRYQQLQQQQQPPPPAAPAATPAIPVSTQTGLDDNRPQPRPRKRQKDHVAKSKSSAPPRERRSSTGLTPGGVSGRPDPTEVGGQTKVNNERPERRRHHHQQQQQSHRHQHHSRGHGRPRSKSEDPNDIPYTGPIIVELATIPNEFPPGTDQVSRKDSACQLLDPDDRNAKARPGNNNAQVKGQRSDDANTDFPLIIVE